MESFEMNNITALNSGEQHKIIFHNWTDDIFSYCPVSILTSTNLSLISNANKM